MVFQIKSHHHFVLCNDLLCITALCHGIQIFLSPLDITYLDRLKGPICLFQSTARWGLTVILCSTNQFPFPPLSFPLQTSQSKSEKSYDGSQSVWTCPLLAWISFRFYCFPMKVIEFIWTISQRSSVLLSSNCVPPANLISKFLQHQSP